MISPTQPPTTLSTSHISSSFSLCAWRACFRSVPSIDPHVRLLMPCLGPGTTLRHPYCLSHNAHPCHTTSACAHWLLKKLAPVWIPCAPPGKTVFLEPPTLLLHTLPFVTVAGRLRQTPGCCSWLSAHCRLRQFSAIAAPRQPQSVLLQRHICSSYRVYHCDRTCV